MSAIRTSLENLLSTVIRLENNLEGYQKQVQFSSSGGQQEMFLDHPSNENNVAIAQRLDVAIEKVEKMLQNEAISN